LINIGLRDMLVLRLIILELLALKLQISVLESRRDRQRGLRSSSGQKLGEGQSKLGE
jgi:hypothetical protein